LWIDLKQERVSKLNGQLQQDVDFGWGILGRLYKGGTIVLDQGDVGDGQWRVVHFEMKMSARVVFRTKVFDTAEDESQFVAVPTGLRYQQAIAILRDNRTSSARKRSGLAGESRTGPT
jgi:hypothetical protein